MKKKENEIEETPYLKFVLTFVLLIGLSTTAEAGGPSSNQYCDIEFTTIDRKSVV